MKRLVALLVVALLAQSCVCQSSMPAVTSPEYLLEPGEYEMTEDIDWSANGVTSMVGNCTDVVAPCVTINMGPFGFSVSSTPAISTMLLSGITFSNYSGSAPAAFTISQVTQTLKLENVDFTNSFGAFISSFPPNALVLSNCALENNNASTLINIFSNPALTEYQYMTSITIDGLAASNNLVTPEPSFNDSLIKMRVSSVDTVTITNSNFTSNPNIIRIGEKQSNGLLVSDGISTLIVKDCIFADHPAIIDSSSSTVLPLFYQTTKSDQPTGAPWMFTSNTFINNSATFIQAVLLDSITLKNNIFEKSPGSYAFVGQTQEIVSFQSNRFLGSGLLSFTTGESLDSGSTPSISFSGDIFNFQSAPSSQFTTALAPISIVNVNLVNFTGVTFENMAPSSISTECSVVRLQAVTSITFDSCVFQNISLYSSTASPTASPSSSPSSPSALTPALASQVSQIAASEIARIAIMWPLGGTNVANVALTLKNTSFGAYSNSDLSTADIGAFDDSGTTTSLTLLSSPSGSRLNISRLASTTTINVQDPLQITDMLFNPLNSNIGSFLLDSDLTVDRPILLYGRAELTLGSSVVFTASPSLNGSIVGATISGSTFVPKVTPSSDTIISVDLGTGLTVPAKSNYTLISGCSITLPTQTVVAPLKDGSSSNSGFTGALSLVNGNVSGTSSLVMTAFPTCSVACVTGICNARDYCDCDDGWSGATCTCLDTGRPSGVSCSSSTTEIEWIASTQQSVTGTLKLASGLTYVVQSDMSVTGTLQLEENALLLVEGQLSVSGSVIMASRASSYPHSCDAYLPTMVASNKLNGASSSNFRVNVNFGDVPKCGNTKKDSLASTFEKRRAMIRDLTDDVSGDYDAILVVNATTAIDGTLTVNATSVTVAAGKQQEAKIVAANSNDVKLSLMTLNVQTQSTICSTTSRTTSAVSLFFNVCSGTKHSAKWWWYGAPIIAVGAIVLLVIILSVAVPPWRRAIYPYSAKAKT